jgi:beta-1,4-mannosyltransferase
MSIRARLGIARRQLGILWRRPRLGVHVWMSDNPYSDVLYRQFRGARAPMPLPLIEDLDAFTRLPAAGRLLWIHSEASYSWGRSGDALADAHRRYLAGLDRWARKGGRLVWTIHDEGLHLNDPDPARIHAIRERLRAMAALVHVHSEAAKASVAERFGIDPARVIVVPHPTYASLYGDAAPTGAEGDGPRRLLCFGHIKPYKNYGALAAALDRLGPGSFARLTIAGKPGGAALPEADYRRNIDLDLRLRFIPDAEVPPLFADADYLVLPYIDTLTSGAAALSMGFGVPVIAPDLGGMREAVPPENRPLLYAADDPDGLTGALRRARDLSAADYRALAERCRIFGEAFHPDRVSADLVRLLDERGLLSPA